jgi:hypothetical protein
MRKRGMEKFGDQPADGGRIRECRRGEEWSKIHENDKSWDVSTVDQAKVLSVWRSGACALQGV